MEHGTIKIYTVLYLLVGFIYYTLQLGIIYLPYCEAQVYINGYGSNTPFFIVRARRCTVACLSVEAAPQAHSRTIL